MPYQFCKRRANQDFVLDQLKSNNSTTIANVSNTLELTTNPIWEVLFALPSLKNDINNSADVVFNKMVCGCYGLKYLKPILE